LNLHSKFIDLVLLKFFSPVLGLEPEGLYVEPLHLPYFLMFFVLFCFVLFCFVLREGLTNYLPGLVSNCSLPDVYLLSS
jgi:hypothetical protein